jgi:hypothetical protein
MLCCFAALSNADDRSSRRDSHVFLRGEKVVLSLPSDIAGTPQEFRILNERHEEIRRGNFSAPFVDGGALPVGWYRIEFLDEQNGVLGFTTAAVLESLAEDVPKDSPICLDGAMAWLGEKDQGDWKLLAQLARLAGVNWIRDRIHWREMQEAPGAFASKNKYDVSADVQSTQGLQILQVFHTRPTWALAPGSNPERPRTDLRLLYEFCRGMAKRFEGRVQAWEPWNEGNARNFGGFTIEELCVLQKAAYLGFKAGDPDLTVCWNPLGGINIESQTQSILRNETWPYYDVYSIHSYDWPHAYEGLWRYAREAASGKALWVTESDRGMTAAPDSTGGDFSPENDRRKAEFIAQSYVRSLFSGASRHFHFILGHYMEGENRTQFGLLRKDHTPRPSYVALAALGRILAGGQCLGRREIEGQPNVHVYAFRARPDGKPRDVLVAWTERQGDWSVRGVERADWPLSESLHVEAVYDYLGRTLEAAVPAQLSPAPIFLVLPQGESEKLSLRTVATVSLREGTPSPVVLQFDAPGTPPVLRSIGWSQEAAYEFSAGATVEAVLTVYNLGAESATGTLKLENLPLGWRAEPSQWNVTLDPMEQEEMALRITLPTNTQKEDAWLDFRGDFGSAGRPMLAVRSRTVPVE